MLLLRRVAVGVPSSDGIDPDRVSLKFDSSDRVVVAAVDDAVADAPRPTGVASAAESCSNGYVTAALTASKDARRVSKPYASIHFSDDDDDDDDASEDEEAATARVGAAAAAAAGSILSRVAGSLGGTNVPARTASWYSLVHDLAVSTIARTLWSSRPLVRSAHQFGLSRSTAAQCSRIASSELMSPRDRHASQSIASSPS
jgi:hypothetical protein